MMQRYIIIDQQYNKQKVKKIIGCPSVSVHKCQEVSPLWPMREAEWSVIGRWMQHPSRNNTWHVNKSINVFKDRAKTKTI